MRAFLAIPLPEAMRKTLAAVGREIEGLRAQREETIHLTLRFLGEIKAAEPVIEAIAPVVAKHRPFDMSLERIGVFPRKGPPRVVWVGLGEGDMQAGALAASLENALLGLGFAREHRPWHGHVTLGRFREPGHPADRIVDRERQFGAVLAQKVILFESRLTPEGAVHAPLQELSLGGAM